MQRGGQGRVAGGSFLEAQVEAVRPPSSPADEAVVEALRRGDEEAFTLLVNQHHGSLRRIARLYVSSPAIADEVVQDTWLAVIQGLWGFEGRSALKTWILRILINLAKTRARREGRTVPLLDLDSEIPEATENVPAETSRAGGEEDRHLPLERGGSRLSPRLARGRRSRPPDAAGSAEAGLLVQEMGAQVRAAIATLPFRQRIVITMRDVEGCSSEEVCNVLGLSETNQRVILHRARSRVRNLMKPYLGNE